MREGAAQRAPEWVARLIAVLFVVAVLANAYSIYLYYLVNHTAEAVHSICSINAQFDCESVARSRYASLANAPVALWGAEFFTLLLVFVLLRRSIASWRGFVFFALLLSAPFSVYLAIVSFWKLKTVCLMCTAVYTTHVVALLVLIATARFHLVRLWGEFRETCKQLVGNFEVVLALTTVGILCLSQVFWAGRVFGLASVKRADGQHTQARFDDSQTSSPTKANDSGLSRAPHKPVPAHGLRLGLASAPVVVELFADFQCPGCRRAHIFLSKLVRQHPEKVQLQHRDFPLSTSCNPALNKDMHPGACLVAQYARCSAELGGDAFWRYSEKLFASGGRVSGADMVSLAAGVGLDGAWLARCSERPDIAQAIVADVRDGLTKGVQGTPAVFVNRELVEHPLDGAFWHQKLGSVRPESQR